MASTIQLRRGSAAAWAAANPILAAGEEGYDLDSRRRKVGDGVTNWALLPYDGGGALGAVAGVGALLLALMPPVAVVDPVPAATAVTVAHNMTDPSGTVVPATAAPVTLYGGIYEQSVPYPSLVINTVNDPHPVKPAP